MTQSPPLPHLVILGAAGFAGLSLYTCLNKRFHITLIDPKTYFEYSPSILDALCLGEKYYKTISYAIKETFPNAKFICDAATRVDFDTRTVSLAKNEPVSYDYLMICTGSQYNFEIKYTNGDTTHSQRCTSISNMRDQLAAAKSIWLVGAGGVGVEYAAAIWEKFNLREADPTQHKQITLEYRSSVLPRCPVAAQEYVSTWMQKRGIRLLASSQVSEEEKSQTEVLIQCHGFRPNTSFIDSRYLDDSGLIRVNEYLQVQGAPENVFALGDCISLPGEEKKMCTAKFQGKWTARNLLRLIKGDSMRAYTPQPFKYNFSLGDNDGVGLSKTKLQFKGKITKVSRVLVRWRTLSLFSSAKQV